MAEPDLQGQPSLIDFPEAMSIKAMGLHTPDFEAFVVDLVKPHVPGGLTDVTTHVSSAGKYMSVRVHFMAENQAQLEAIYRALQAEERVLFTL